MILEIGTKQMIFSEKNLINQEQKMERTLARTKKARGVLMILHAFVIERIDPYPTVGAIFN